MKAHNRIDLSGMSFGRLKVISYTKTVRKIAHWTCLCECGTIKEISGAAIRRGDIQSCGCLSRDMRTTHNLSTSGVYGAWKALKQRCLNPKTKQYDQYHQRGVCDGIRDSFERFLGCVGHKPSKDHTIDRIDNFEGYHCGVCFQCVSKLWGCNLRWATRQQQADNRNTTRTITINGLSKTIPQWSYEIGLSYTGMRHRLNRGLTGVDLIKPSKRRQK